MDIVPVIDLMAGQVVRARHGDRASYRPIVTPLSPTSDPSNVVAGLLSLHAFGRVYVADLDRIEGKGDNDMALDGIASRFPGLELWVDNGCAAPDEAEAFCARHAHAALVLGSESQRDATLVTRLRQNNRIILSLDFRGDGFVGPATLLDDAGLWPERLIVMTLARVGGDAGPDLARFGTIAARAEGRALYLAGGVRDARDLRAARAAGAAGVLVASALHEGRLTSADLRGPPASGGT